MKTLLIEGWRGINHSYALVNQYQLLHLAGHPDFVIYHRDVPLPRPEWKNTGSGFDDEDIATINSFGPPGNTAIDILYRMDSQGGRLYGADSFGVQLSNAVYALDSTPIDLCLLVFRWAHFRSTKAAVTTHTLLELRGNISRFIHVSDGKLHDVNVLDLLIPEAGAFYVMDRGYIDFARLYTLHQAGAFFVTHAKSNLDARRVYSASGDRTTGVICDQRVGLNGFYIARDYPNSCVASAIATPNWPRGSGLRARNAMERPLGIAWTDCSKCVEYAITNLLGN